MTPSISPYPVIAGCDESGSVQEQPVVSSGDSNPLEPVAHTDKMASIPPTDVKSPDPSLKVATEADLAWKVSKGRRYFLLAIFSLAQALDVLNISAVTTTAEQIALSLGLAAGNITWILTAYAMCFAGFMLFAGRLADLFSAQRLFEGGAIGMGACLLADSFMGNKYAFLVFRALQGICAAATVPAAFHMIVHLFPDRHEQRVALAALGLSGGLANSIGVVIGGLFALASWRWLFRFLAFLACLAGSLGVAFLSQYTRAQRLDLIGVFLLTGSLLLFILGLTSGTVYGWTDGHFLAPFLIGCTMFVAFFFWERTLPDERAMLPHSLWKKPNLPLLAFTALSPYMFWACTQFQMTNYWQVTQGITPLLAASRLLPEGIAALSGGILVRLFPAILVRPKWTIIGGLAMEVLGLVLVILSNGGNGNRDYFGLIFPGFIIGSFGAIITYLALNVSIVQAMHSSASGVAGALLGTCLQIGSVIGLSVQAGLFSRVNSDYAVWKGTQYGFYFSLVWTAVTALLDLVAHRPAKIEGPGVGASAATGVEPIDGHEAIQLV